jgi:hypothetical protein
MKLWSNYNIMKTQTYRSERFKTLFSKQKIATLEQLKEALGTQTTMTVFRKLKQLSYYTSYSHRGKYYTLVGVAQFDEHGLWSCKKVHFSQYGTLLETLKELIYSAASGYSSKELKSLLNVEVKGALLTLIKNNLIVREEISGHTFYFSTYLEDKRRQRYNRMSQIKEALLGATVVSSEILEHELRAAIILFFSLLDEKQRRLYAGLESLKLGYGGDKKIAELLNIDSHTVAKGRHALLNQAVDMDRIRRKGGGRDLVEKKHQRSLNK